MNSRDETVLRKMLKYCDEINRTHAFFENDKELFSDKERGFIYRNSITMPILQIGELAKVLSEEMRGELKDIPWKEISGMRDVFAHHYGSIDYDIVWQTSKTDITDLRSRLVDVVNAAQEQGTV